MRAGEAHIAQPADPARAAGGDPQLLSVATLERTRTMHDKDNLYPSLHFAIVMPDGPDSKDLPMLLERLAAELRELPPPLLDHRHYISVADE